MQFVCGSPVPLVIFKEIVLRYCALIDFSWMCQGCSLEQGHCGLIERQLFEMINSVVISYLTYHMEILLN